MCGWQLAEPLDGASLALTTASAGPGPPTDATPGTSNGACSLYYMQLFLSRSQAVGGNGAPLHARMVAPCRFIHGVERPTRCQCAPWYPITIAPGRRTAAGAIFIV